MKRHVRVDLGRHASVYPDLDHKYVYTRENLDVRHTTYEHVHSIYTCMPLTAWNVLSFIKIKAL